MKMTKLVSMSTIAATFLSGLVLAASPVQAASWTARKPSEIQIAKGQKKYIRSSRAIRYGLFHNEPTSQLPS